MKKTDRLFLSILICALVTGQLHAQSKSTYANDDLRTGWYPNESMLAPATVGSSLFGKLFDTPIVGQVYAQPLVSGNIVFVATEANWIYGLDVLTGSVQWSRNVGPAWNTSDYGCSDLTPTLGITSTPVIDNTGGTAYFMNKTYLNGSSGPGAFFMHAVDVTTGAERPNFPVQITGAASNDPSSSFNGTMQGNRPGLLLMNNVVYAGFGSMCDIQPFKGWVAGVSAGGRLTALWTASPGFDSGAGIWQAGGGLVSDGPGRIFLATGNGYSSTPNGTYASSAVPAGLAESVVRLAVQPDGSLKADNFFSPYDSLSLDGWDADLGSGAPVGLPSAYFGTPSNPNLLFVCGKQGYVYLLNRDNLGGQGMGSGGADRVLGRIGPYGGVWSRPAVWPGDGGHLFVVSAASSNTSVPTSGQMRSFGYGLDGTGNPAISMEASTNEQFGSYSSSPVVTSDGTTSGSALVWLIQAPDGTGNNAQLMAYDATPVNGQMNLRYSTPVGQASKFTPPGVGPARIYVGTRDGHLLGFGLPANVALSAPLTQFGSVVAGQSASATATLTASTEVTIQSVTTSNPVFQVAQITLPATLSEGESFSVPMQFTPTSSSLQSGNLHVITNLGPLDFSLVGNGVNPQAHLEVFPAVLSLGGTAVGGTLAGSVIISNDGGQPLTIQNLVGPNTPFSVSGAPPANTVLAPGQAITVTVQFAPSTTGSYTDSLEVVSSGGTTTVNLSAASNAPGALTVNGQSLNYGRIGVSSTSTLNFTVANTGASALTITKSKPPSLGPFSAVAPLPEGTVLQAGELRQIGVQFAPPSAGNFSDNWTLNSDTGTGLTTVTLNGLGTAASGLLSASVNALPGAISLTGDGTADWIHWGDNSRKAQVLPQITMSIIGNESAATYNDDRRSQSWTDGSPMVQATGERSGNYLWGVGNGFAIVAPADRTTRTLTVHVGGWNSAGQLQATLSDGSVLPYSDTTALALGSYYRDYTFTYQAASANQTLRVTWTMTDGTGNVTLSSAALKGVARAASGTLLSSVNAIPGNISLTTDGTADWAHWGDTDRKMQVTPQITMSVIGSQTSATYDDDGRSQNWTDGSPTAQASGEKSGIYLWGVSNGFALVAPADQNTRTLTAHVGGWNSAGQLQATLSDGSALPYSDTTAVAVGSYYRDYTLTYQAGTANQTLQVTWTMTAGSGNLTLSSASLNGAGTAPAPAAPTPTPAPTPAPSSPPSNPGTVPTGWVNLVSQNSGKCADIEYVSTSPGARVHQWTCVNGENQKFQFTPVSGGYEISVKNSGLALTVNGGASALQNGAYLVQDTFSGQTNQVFNLQPMADGTFEIVALHSGKCMDVEGVSKSNGAYIHQWTCLSASNQKWSLIPAQ